MAVTARQVGSVPMHLWVSDGLGVAGVWVDCVDEGREQRDRYILHSFLGTFRILSVCTAMVISATHSVPGI